MKYALLFSFLFVFSTCTMKKNESDISLDKACEIAKKEVAARDSWPIEELACEGQETEGKFELTVWRLPQTPGRFRKVTVSPKGAVLTYSKGK